MFGLITAALVGFSIGVAIVVLILRLRDIINWFKNRITESDKEKLAFTIKELLKNGQHKTIRGIFNKSTNKILDAEQIQSNEIDDELAKAHENNELVIYE
jgi:hypothetical protein